MKKILSLSLAFGLCTAHSNAFFSATEGAPDFYTTRQAQKRWEGRGDAFRLFGLGSATLGTAAWGGHGLHRLVSSWCIKPVGTPRISIALTGASAFWTTCSGASYKYAKWIESSQ